jgi:hypothetical protein
MIRQNVLRIRGAHSWKAGMQIAEQQASNDSCPLIIAPLNSFTCELYFWSVRKR